MHTLLPDIKCPECKNKLTFVKLSHHWPRVKLAYFLCDKCIIDLQFAQFSYDFNNKKLKKLHSKVHQWNSEPAPLVDLKKIYGSND